MIAFMKYLMFFLMLNCLTVMAQTAKTNNLIENPPKKSIKTYAKVVDGDTVPLVYLKPVWIIEKRVFKNQFQAWKYGRLVKNVKVTLPYAKIAGRKMKEYNKLLLAAKTETEKSKIMKKVEKELKAEFEDELKDLTTTQGMILMKLIDRETGNTTYTLVKELRGTMSATFWQSLAVVFGNSLKQHYEPDGDDKQVEQIIQLIEKGEI